MGGEFIAVSFSGLCMLSGRSTPKVLVDEHSLVFAALCGQPAAAEWPHVISSAGKEIYSAHQRLRKDQDDHGRVEFPVVCAGVSHGGSRKV